MEEVKQVFVITAMNRDDDDMPIKEYYAEKYNGWSIHGFLGTQYETYGEAELKVIELVKNNKIVFGQIDKIYIKA